MGKTKTSKLYAQRLAGHMSNTVSAVGDVPGHEFAHRVFSLFVTSDDSDFNGFNTINYFQTDEINGTGTFHGYAAWPLNNGDTVYIKFDSVTRRVNKDDGSWEAPYEGRLEFVAGTGKYKNIKGVCHYEGVSTATGSFWWGYR